MTETVVSEVWSELKRYISTVDRAEAAEIIISILVDHDSDIEDIKNAFKGDPDIKSALMEYTADDKGDDEDSDDVIDNDDYNDDYNDDNWEN